MTTRDDSRSYTRQNLYQTDVGGNVTITRSYVTLTQTDVRGGQSNPGWKRAIQSMQNATSPYSRTIRSIDGGGCEESVIQDRLNPYTHLWENEYTTYRQFYTDPGTPSPPATASADLLTARNRAWLKFLAQANQSTTDGASILAEIRSTLDGLRNPLEAAIDLTNNLGDSIEREFRGRKRAQRLARHGGVRNLSDAFLEYHFGLQPLWSDVMDIARSVSDLTNDEHVKRFSADGYARNSSTTSGLEYDSWHNTRDNWEYHVRFKGAIALRTSLNSELSTLEQASERFNLTMQGALQGAWELVPYSWLVDWALPVTDWIGAQGALSIPLIYSCESNKTTGTRDRTYYSKKDFDSSSVRRRYRSSGSMTVRSMTYTRTVPTPTYTPSLLDFAVDIPRVGWERAATLASLLGQKATSAADRTVRAIRRSK